MFRLFQKNLYFKKYVLFFHHNIRKYTSCYVPFVHRIRQYYNSLAIVDDSGFYKYKDVLFSAYLLSKEIDKIFTKNRSHVQERIAFLCSNDATYASVLLACWLSGNIAIPLCSNHPESLLEYFVSNSESNLIISNDLFQNYGKSIASKLNITHLICKNIQADTNLQCEELKILENSFESDALIIYTSGSTGLPKGVVLNHGNLNAQVSSLAECWEVNANDSILHTLPLHHMHGIMNALLCVLSVGGSIVMRPKFQVSEVWKYLLNSTNIHHKINLFYGVPTMYSKLIEEYHKSYSNISVKKECEKIRLMTSGSAALPEPVFHEWYDITGHKLLERFGMSEIGMALSNPLKGPRIPGTVGQPLPGVEVRIVEIKNSTPSTIYVEGNDSEIHVRPNSTNATGELLIRGPNVFKKYWNNEKATKETFTKCGWFITGDYAKYEDKSFKILGRTSVDIIKSGGFKISALQIESCLLLHPNIIDCSVFGIPDNKWGEKIVALIVTKDSKEIMYSDIKTWCKERVPTYSIPSEVKFVHDIPRNVMGKMNKKELKALFT